MTRFSANLGFLWTELELPDAVRAAHRAGFAAVECHWPFEVPPERVNAALAETGLPMLGLNTRRGDVAAGDAGLCAVPGREVEARAAIAEAMDYAAAIGARNVHVMAGTSEGEAARACFISNLRHASALARTKGITVLIEPLNPHDAPGYFLRETGQAADIIAELGAVNVKLMFDCYHVARTEGDVIGRLHRLMPLIGHVQFAGVPDRGRPDRGELDYRQVFGALRDMVYDRPLGAEYRPDVETEASLGWMQTLI